MRRSAILLACVFGATEASAQSYDPLGGGAPPSGPAPIAAPSSAPPPPTLPTAPKSGAEYDPYGRWEHAQGPDQSMEVSRLLAVEDGTPLYEDLPKFSATTPSVASRMLPIYAGSNLAFEAGPKSPYLPGTPFRFAPHYLINFWKTYPQAKVRGPAGGSRAAPGVVEPLSRRSVISEGVPPAVVDVMFAQAQALYAAVIAIPVIQRAQGMTVQGSVRMGRGRDIAGTEVYAFDLIINGVGLDITDPKAVRGPDGRWRSPPRGHLDGMKISVNRPIVYGPAWGTYRGTQVGHDAQFIALVVSTTRPTHISEFRGGGGQQVPNPTFFDPARPKTDIQVMTVRAFASSPIDDRHSGQGSLSPDSIFGRLMAASFIPDWKTIVDRVNSPGAPRAK